MQLENSPFGNLNHAEKAEIARSVEVATATEVSESSPIH